MFLLQQKSDETMQNMLGKAWGPVWSQILLCGADGKSKTQKQCTENITGNQSVCNFFNIVIIIILIIVIIIIVIITVIFIIVNVIIIILLSSSLPIIYQLLNSIVLFACPAVYLTIVNYYNYHRHYQLYIVFGHCEIE